MHPTEGESFMLKSKGCRRDCTGGKRHSDNQEVDYHRHMRMLLKRGRGPTR